MTPPSSPPATGDGDRDRAQLILVGAVAIAIILMGLVVVFNTVLYTDAKTSTTTLDEANQAQAFTQQVRKEIGSIAGGLAASNRLTASNLTAAIDEWSEVQSISHAHTGPVFVGIDPTTGSCIPSPCSLTSTYRVTVTWQTDGYSLNTTVTAPLSQFAGTVAYVNNSQLRTASNRGVNGVYPNTTITSVAGPIDPGLDSDGGMEIVYGNTSPTHEIAVLNADTGVTIDLVQASGTSTDPRTIETSIAVGKWNGSDTSVLYADQGDNGIWLVNVSSRFSPTKVASDEDGDGTSAVVGIGDVNADADDEIVYVDGSQIIKYFEGGTSTTIGQTGRISGSSVGTGRLVDFDGDGKEGVFFVDTSNDIKFKSPVEPGFTISLSGAPSDEKPAKSPIAPVDVDGDGELEIVYKNINGKLVYLDNLEPYGYTGSDLNQIKEFSPEDIRPDGGATQ